MNFNPVKILNKNFVQQKENDHQEIYLQGEKCFKQFKPFE